MKRKVIKIKKINRILKESACERDNFQNNRFNSLEKKIKAIKSYIKSDGKTLDPLPNLFLEMKNTETQKDCVPVVEIFEI